MKRKVSIFEIIWYTLSGITALTGFVFIILGLLGDFGGKDFVSLRDFSNPGSICFVCGAIAATIVLIICAKGSDRASEAAARRAARLAKVEAPVEAGK